MQVYQFDAFTIIIPTYPLIENAAHTHPLIKSNDYILFSLLLAVAYYVSTSVGTRFSKPLPVRRQGSASD